MMDPAGIPTEEHRLQVLSKAFPPFSPVVLLKYVKVGHKSKVFCLAAVEKSAYSNIRDAAYALRNSFFNTPWSANEMQ